ncbi:hypothetical protein FH972_007235 [Carpinus fangiana]|uniref:60S ribosomal protein L17 n=1 Tax=Carpinus fangiana TaxID=176857 RepID=A0A5N6QUS2_9ROSI|nr:hypothetical protein FH972_007235 [Carpinus fangiana]
MLFGSCFNEGQKAKNRHSNGQGRWPFKSAKFILDLLKNAESNAEVKSLDVDSLYISHIQVNQAQKHRRQTYCAHGRINRPFIFSFFFCLKHSWLLGKLRMLKLYAVVLLLECGG